MQTSNKVLLLNDVNIYKVFQRKCFGPQETNVPRNGLTNVIVPLCMFFPTEYNRSNYKVLLNSTLIMWSNSKLNFEISFN